MDKPINRKKGFSLAELCVVFAIIAIVAVMVVFFSTYLSRRVRQNDECISILKDADNAETFVESWIDEFRLLGATFNVDSDSKVLAIYNEEEYSLSFADGSLIAIYLDKTDVLKLKEFSTFNVKLETVNNNKIIFICTLTAQISTSANISIYPYSFSVYPMVGIGGEVA